MRTWRDVSRGVRHEPRFEPWDVVLAGLMAATSIVVLRAGIDVEGVGSDRPASAVGWAATFGICLTLLGRRRWPSMTVTVVVALLVVLGATDNGDVVGFPVLLLGLYSVAAHRQLRVAMRAAAMVMVLVAVSVLVFHNQPIVGVIGAAGAFALGWMTRLRRERQEDQAAEAKSRAVAAIEIAELGVAADRQRMAQELHDVVAHSLSVIAVQAGIGAHLIDRVPAEAARALYAIRAASSDAEAELARLIDVLRGSGCDTTEPAPTLADVESLCVRLGAAGVPVDLVVEGDLGALPNGVSLAAYRIVQEALTNVVRHAGPASAKVTVQATAGDVELRVTDDGASARPPSTSHIGHGLIGMRERAQMYGGDVAAGPRPGGGFGIHATLHAAVDVDLAGEARVEESVDSGPVVPQIPRVFRRTTQMFWDVALATVFIGFAVAELIGGREAAIAPASTVFTPTDSWAWILKILCCLTLIGRRRFPTSTLLAATVLGVALTVGDYDVGIIVAVLVVGLYAVGSYATTPRFLGAMAGIVVVMSFVAWSDPPDLNAAGAVWTAVIGAAAATAGFVVRIDRERRDATTAEHEDAGATESRRARLAVAAERLRIADELNSAITRSIRSISITAGSGSQIVETDPAAALEILDSISHSSRDALADLRRLLKRMRTVDEPSRYAPAAPPRRTITSGRPR